MAKQEIKVLVVDDEVQICELIESFLSHEGYRVMTALNGDEAIRKFSEEKPHIVFLDIRMPGMSGMDVLRRMKEIDPNAGIIILSAFGDMATVEASMDLGAHSYIQKPVDLKHLTEIVSAWGSSQGLADCHESA